MASTYPGRARASGCAAAMVGSMSWVSWRHQGAWWSQKGPEVGAFAGNGGNPEMEGLTTKKVV